MIWAAWPNTAKAGSWPTRAFVSRWAAGRLMFMSVEACRYAEFKDYKEASEGLDLEGNDLHPQ